MEDVKMSKKEQVLILGNGFDLAHDLPTKYEEFLKFTEYVLALSDKSFYENQNQENVSRIIKTLLEEKCELKDEKVEKFLIENAQIDIKLVELLNNNKWVYYFKTNKENRKENWIDFESEIADVIKLLEEVRKKYYVKAVRKIDEIEGIKEYNIFLDCMGLDKNPNGNKITSKDFENINKILLKDLENLIKALEIYLRDYVGKYDIDSYSQNIIDLNPKYILSFSYTDTYEKIYKLGDEEKLYCYIHGKIRRNKKESCNMILGIDEYLEDDERQENDDFLEFQKYYQRIKKQTYFSFNKWLEQLKNENKNNKIKVYIFGHSLDVTDKDILLEFLKNKNCEVYIFYKDKKAYGSQIANLIKLIGREELLERLKNQIKFIKQTDMKKIKDSTFDVERDIRKLSILDKMNDEEMDNLLDKLKRKITNRDIKYFQNQENVVRVFYEMYEKKLVSKKCAELMLQVIEGFEKSESFNVDDWFYISIDQREYQPKGLVEFINKVKDLNERKKKVIEENGDLEQFKIRIEGEDILEEYETRRDLQEEECKKLIEEVLKSMKDQKNCEIIMRKLSSIIINNTLVAQKVLVDIKKDETTSRNNKIRINSLLHDCEEIEYIRDQVEWDMKQEAEALLDERNLN